ncbi:MAG: hypothetical protein KTR31_34415 [Myxococcales bacterium]|nr:hypothetical protein [Myxococcales bacterium]
MTLGNDLLEEVQKLGHGPFSFFDMTALLEGEARLVSRGTHQFGAYFVQQSGEEILDRLTQQLDAVKPLRLRSCPHPVEQYRSMEGPSYLLLYYWAHSDQEILALRENPSLYSAQAGEELVADLATLADNGWYHSQAHLWGTWLVGHQSGLLALDYWHALEAATSKQTVDRHLFRARETLSHWEEEQRKSR